MCPSLIQIGLKTAEKNSAQTNRQTDRHYENNGHLAVNQKYTSALLYPSRRETKVAHLPAILYCLCEDSVVISQSVAVRSQT